MSTETPTKWISKRQARNLFRAAKYNEQEMFPAAQRHYDAHGSWPGDYLAAKICSGITVLVDDTTKEN